MRSNWKTLLILSVAFTAFGCSDSLSEEESSQGFAAANLVLQQGGSAAQATPAALVTADYSFTCAEGGSATFSGEYDDMADAGNADFNFTVGFDGCVSQGVTIDGSMTYKLSANVTETSTKLKYSYVGDLAFSGEVDGDCEMDFTGSIETSSNGGGSGSFNINYSGTICGNDAGGALGGSGNYSGSF